MKKFCFFLFAILSAFCFSQKIDKQNPFFTVRGSIGIPRSTGSQMFRQSFSGIYEGNIAACIRPGKNIFVGLGYQNALFKNVKSIGNIQYNFGGPNSKVSLTTYNTQIIEHSAFLKLGYDQYIGELVYMSYALNSGMTFAQYTGVLPDTNVANRPYGETRFAAPYVQPELAVNFIAGEEQKLSFSILLSYTTLFYKFDPKSPRFNHFESPPVYTKGNRYFMNWLNIGLGFNILLGKRSGGSAPVNEPTE